VPQAACTPQPSSAVCGLTAGIPLVPSKPQPTWGPITPVSLVPCRAPGDHISKIVTPFQDSEGAAVCSPLKQEQVITESTQARTSHHRLLPQHEQRSTSCTRGMGTAVHARRSPLTPVTTAATRSRRSLQGGTHHRQLPHQGTGPTQREQREGGFASSARWCAPATSPALPALVQPAATSCRALLFHPTPPSHPRHAFPLRMPSPPLEPPGGVWCELRQLLQQLWGPGAEGEHQDAPCTHHRQQPAGSSCRSHVTCAATPQAAQTAKGGPMHHSTHMHKIAQVACAAT
jgi:hypothetical protein